MRKVRNQQIHSANPGLLFARGVEQLVTDQLYNPSRSDSKPAPRKPRAARNERRVPAGSFFSDFLRQFVF